MLCMHKTTILCQFGSFVTSLPTHISIKSHPFLVGIVSFKHESMGGKRHWLIVLDEFSDCSHSFFLKRKSDQIELFPNWIKELKAKYGIDIKYVRLDNSGENKGLQNECKKQNLGIIFEFTAPGTFDASNALEAH